MTCSEGLWGEFFFAESFKSSGSIISSYFLSHYRLPKEIKKLMINNRKLEKNIIFPCIFFDEYF